MAFLQRRIYFAASVLLLVEAWAYADGGLTNGPTVSNRRSSMGIPDSTPQTGSNDNSYESRNAAFEKFAAQQRENNSKGNPPPPSQFHFPSVYGEPLHPSPCYVDFYSVNDHYPDYLLCEYDVDETSYSESAESKWFGDALAQIRHHGPKKFPPVKWVAVIIRNRAEHKGVSTFEQSFKVGAIFKAAGVFDASHDVPGLIAQVSLDRHPFHFDQTKSDLFPVDQQRWIIVEQHAVTNRPAEKTK